MKYHTTTSASRELGVTRQAIEKAIKNGRIHAHKAGGTVWVLTGREVERVRGKITNLKK